jgi:hypothetical protein
MIIKKYPVDALYPSWFDWVACDYLMDKVKQGAWKNIFQDDCQTHIVSAEAMSFEDYKKAHVTLSGRFEDLEERYQAMTTCPLLKTMFGICEIK